MSERGCRLYGGCECNSHLSLLHHYLVYSLPLSHYAMSTYAQRLLFSFLCLGTVIGNAQPKISTFVSAAKSNTGRRDLAAPPLPSRETCIA